MSVWIEVLEVLGWCLIPLGAWSTFSAVKDLRQLIRRGKSEVIKRDLRLEAWRSVLAGPFYLTSGVFSVTYRWTHDTLIWIWAAYAVMLAIWSVGSRSWFRNKGDQAGPAAGQP